MNLVNVAVLLNVEKNSKLIKFFTVQYTSVPFSPQREPVMQVLVKKVL
jgi:hypothetical protein